MKADITIVRRQEKLTALLVAAAGATAAGFIEFTTGADLALPVAASLAIYAAIEAIRLTLGTPLHGSILARAASLALWTGISYVSFDLGVWYALPVTLLVATVLIAEGCFPRHHDRAR